LNHEVAFLWLLTVIFLTKKKPPADIKGTLDFGSIIDFVQKKFRSKMNDMEKK